MGRKKLKRKNNPIGEIVDFIEDVLEFAIGAIIVIVIVLIVGISDANLLTDKLNTESSVEATPTSESSSTTIEMEEVTVTRVIDGDTIECSNGETIRLIGVDTPEYTSEKERYGKEATDYTEDNLEGETVWLTKDVSETDQYGRSLRFVWTEPPTSFTEEEFREKCFNADLVLNGYATEATYSPDDTYASYFKKFEKEAKEAGVGMWAK